MIKEIVVDRIDEKLGGGAVWFGSACHGDGTAFVFQPVVRLVLDGLAGGLSLHIGCESAALNHESGDHPVEYHAVIVPGSDIGQKVFNGLRGLLSKKLK